MRGDDVNKTVQSYIDDFNASGQTQAQYWRDHLQKVMSIGSWHGNLYRYNRAHRQREHIPVKDSESATPYWAAATIRPCVLDLERTIEGGDEAGTLLCSCIIDFTTGSVEQYNLSFEDGTNDQRLVEETIEALRAFDIFVGHAITGSDLNMLYTKHLYYGSPCPPSGYIFDTYECAKSIAIKSAKSLAVLGEFFDIAEKKQRVSYRQWQQAMSRDQKEHDEAMEVLRGRNMSDAIMVAQVLPYIWGAHREVRRYQMQRTKW